MEADAIVIKRDAALELRIKQGVPRLRRAIREGFRPISQHIDIAICVDDRIAVETNRLGKIGGVLEVRQVRKVFRHAAQCRFGRIGGRIPVEVDRRNTLLRDRSPELRLDFVVFGQVVADGNAGLGGKRIGHASFQRIHPAAAPGAHDQFLRLCRFFGKGARKAERRRAGCSGKSARALQEAAAVEDQKRLLQIVHFVSPVEFPRNVSVMRQRR